MFSKKPRNSINGYYHRYVACVCLIFSFAFVLVYYSHYSKLVFVYDGALLDSHPHSDKQIYRHTLERLQRLGAEVIHAGHSPSFGGEQLNAIVESYFSGQNVMPDVKEWFAEFQADENDPYANQNWPESGC